MLINKIKTGQLGSGAVIFFAPRADDRLTGVASSLVIGRLKKLRIRFVTIGLKEEEYGL